MFRIDHFLGKEAVQNILALRFANGLIEPAWNRDHLVSVQIDVPETLTAEGRGSFYESTGCFRDMISTHLCQVLGFVAMEPPGAPRRRPRCATRRPRCSPRCGRWTPTASCSASTRATATRTTSPTTPTVETFVALEAFVDTERWQGVPFLPAHRQGAGRHPAHRHADASAPRRWDGSATASTGPTSWCSN